MLMLSLSLVRRLVFVALMVWILICIFFIPASKCDDISCSEVIRALKLEDDPVLEDIEERLDNYEEETQVWKAKKSEAEKTIKGSS